MFTEDQNIVFIETVIHFTFNPITFFYYLCTNFHFKKKSKIDVEQAVDVSALDTFRIARRACDVVDVFIHIWVYITVNAICLIPSFLVSSALIHSSENREIKMFESVFFFRFHQKMQCILRSIYGLNTERWVWNRVIALSMTGTKLFRGARTQSPRHEDTNTDTEAWSKRTEWKDNNFTSFT